MTSGELSSSLKETMKVENSSKNFSDEAEKLAKTEKILAKIDYEYYLEYVHRGLYQHAKHTKLIAKKLEEVEKGKCKRLMIFLPPRHSKSLTVSETFPSFFIGKNLNRRVILVSYGDNLARRFGRANRNKLEEFGNEIFGVKLSNDNFSATNWSINGYRGGMVSTGIGGAITGEGADLLIIDDPIKNRKEADSKTYRDMVWHEWQNTLYTRLQPAGAVIIILTRWHEDDLAGRLLNPEYGVVEDWDIIRLPALAEENDLLGRKEGEPLWPEFGFDLEWAEATKKAIGTRAWVSLYQQRPAPAEGSIVNREWWQFYTERPRYFDEVIQSWDLTFKETNDGSYVVGQVWGRKGADKYLIDQVRARMDFTKTLAAIKSLTAKYPEARLKLIEDTANGPAIINTLKKEISGIVPVKATGSKEARASAVSPDIEAGNVYLPSPAIAPWIHDFIEEWAAFPNGQNNDIVDATSQALIRLGEGITDIDSVRLLRGVKIYG